MFSHVGSNVYSNVPTLLREPHSVTRPGASVSTTRVESKDEASYVKIPPPGSAIVPDGKASSTSSSSSEFLQDRGFGDSLYAGSVGYVNKIFMQGQSQSSLRLNSRSTKRQLAGLPPARQLVPIHTHCFRHQVNTAVTAVPFGLGGLFGMCGVIGTVTNSTAVSITSSLRIIQVDIYPPASTSTASSTFIEWATSFSGFVKDVIVDSSLPAGITNTKPLFFTPPPKSLAGDWMSVALSASAAIMYLTAPAGSILDFHVQYTQQGSITGYTFTGIAAVTLGGFYYLAPDGVASNKVRPVGLPTTS